MERSNFRRFVGYYKWHLMFLLLIIVCLVFIIKSCSTDTAPDLRIGYIATPFVNEEDFESNKPKFEHLLHDANEDKKKIAELVPYTVDKQDEINDLFVDMIESESYHIYILPKEAFIAYKDKSAFASISVNAGNTETIKDGKGRVYAYSVEGNSYLESLGFLNTDNLFIAAADFKDKELSTEEKNGINITKEIIEKRKD